MSKTTRQPSTGALLAFTLLWCALTGVLAVIVARNIVTHALSQGRYVSAQGTVLESKLVSHEGHSESRTTYSPHVVYRFVAADGQEYIGRRYDFEDIHTSGPWANAIVESHKPGQNVTVYYDSADPNQSVLNMGAPATSYFMLVFLQPFVAVGVGMAAFTIAQFRGKRRTARFLKLQSLAEGVPMWGSARRQGHVLCIVGPSAGRAAAWAALAVWGVTGFAAIFVTGLLAGQFDHPQPHVAALTVAVCVAAGLAAGAAVAAAHKRPWMAVDTGRSIISTSSGNRWSFREIASWTVRQIPNPRKLKSNLDTAAAPALMVVTTDGRQTQAHLFPARPEAISIAQHAAWLLADATGSAGPQDPAPAPQNV
jgi:hypothetical protein